MTAHFLISKRDHFVSEEAREHIFKTCLATNERITMENVSDSEQKLSSVQNEIPHINFYVRNKNIEEDISELLKALKDWDPHHVIQKPLSGGFLNEVIQCWNKANEKEVIVVRVFMDKMGILTTNREDEIKCVKVLSKAGCFPKLQGTFQNGYCYEFYDGQCLFLTLDRVFEEQTIRAIAKGLALVHSTKIEGVSKESWLIKAFKEIKDDITEDQWKKMIQEIPELPSLDEYMKEVNSVIQMVESLENPLVLCHGDPHIGNIIWNFKDEHVVFVDSDMTGYNYQAADIAYHFYSYHYDEVYGRDICPEDEGLFRRRWLKEYLQSWFEVTGKESSDVTEDEIERLDILVKKLSLLICAVFPLLCLQNHNVEYRRQIDIIKFVAKMCFYYRANKETFWSL